MGELAIEIEEMLENGHCPKIVSQVLEIPLSWVLDFLEIENNVEGNV